MKPLTLTTDTSGLLVRHAEVKSAYDAKTARLASINPNAKKIDDAAKNFESVFATEMLKPMFEDTAGGGAYGGGQGEKVFNSMQLTQYGKMIGQNDSFGIAKMIKGDLLRLQERH